MTAPLGTGPMVFVCDALLVPRELLERVVKNHNTTMGAALLSGNLDYTSAAYMAATLNGIERYLKGSHVAVQRPVPERRTPPAFKPSERRKRSTKPTQKETLSDT